MPQQENRTQEIARNFIISFKLNVLILRKKKKKKKVQLVASHSSKKIIPLVKMREESSPFAL